MMRGHNKQTLRHEQHLSTLVENIRQDVRYPHKVDDQPGDCIYHSNFSQGFVCVYEWTDTLYYPRGYGENANGNLQGQSVMSDFILR